MKVRVQIIFEQISLKLWALLKNHVKNNIFFVNKYRKDRSNNDPLIKWKF